MKSLFLSFVFSVICHAATVVTVGVSGPLASQVRLAARFYGLEVQEIAGQQLDNRTVVRALANSNTVAAVASGESLSWLERHSILSALRRARGDSTPLLLVGSGSGSESLEKWTGGAVTSCRIRSERSEEWGLRIENSSFAGPLAHADLPFRGSVVCGLVLNQGASARVLSEAHFQKDVFPVFVDAGLAGQRLFVAAGLTPSHTGSVIGQRRSAEEFAGLAPVMMFLRYAAGEKAWHAPSGYANLTVDDPWLREPYGNLNFGELAAQMKLHNFHTTVAFIPWNFDRSESAVVAMFRGNPERFSVAIHGNNHNHREFDSYIEAPLAGQSANLKQALARMDLFTGKTGIPYDPVMIFPHAVSPAETFSSLKEMNYWATTNSENVPLGSKEPDDSLFPLRPETLAFNNFLSIKRVSAEVPVSRINLAINAFLGNPLLLYVHQEFFSTDAAAFNPIADYINKVAPNTKWSSLGQIVQHMYLQRKRPDGDWDVLTFSPIISLTGRAEQDVVFHVTKAENYKTRIRSLTVGGRPQDYQALKDTISFSVAVPAGQSRIVQVTYGDDLQLATTDVSRANLMTGATRVLSDFRDNVLSRNAAGRTVVDLYSWVGAGRLFAVLLICFMAVVGVRSWLNRKRITNGRTIKTVAGLSPDLPGSQRVEGAASTLDNSGMAH